LKIISTVTQQLITKAIKTGIDGIFYAVQQAQYGALSEQEFETFGKAYDWQTLECAGDLWLNTAHIHGENTMFDQIAQWETMVLLGAPTPMRSEAQQATRAADRRRLILGIGCVLPIIAPHANILAVRQSGTTETEQ